ncbi:hypothetical protein D3C71_1963400 [compost metagenome]
MSKSVFLQLYVSFLSELTPRGLRAAWLVSVRPAIVEPTPRTMASPSFSSTPSTLIFFRKALDS